MGSDSRLSLAGSTVELMRRGVILTIGAALLAALVMAGCRGQTGSPRATVTTAAASSTRATTTTAPATTAVAATAPATSAPSPATATPAESVTTTPAEPVATGLLARAGNGVLFIQWTRTPTAVDGTLTSVYTSTDDPTQLHTNTNSFTGIVSGSSVTLTMDTGTKWIGTLNGRNATLSFTASDGTISSWTFTPATTDEYNQAVAEVKSGAATAQSEKQQADATAKAQAQIDSDASTLTSDIANLQDAVSQLSTDLGVAPGHLNTMRSDLALQLKHLRAFLATGGFADSCSNGDSYQVSSTDNYQVVSTDDYRSPRLTITRSGSTLTLSRAGSAS